MDWQYIEKGDFDRFMMSKRLFPLYVDLSVKKVVIVGGGEEGARKVKTLLPFTRSITVIAPEVDDSLKSLAAAGHIEVIQRRVKKSDLTHAFLVIAATNDWDLNDAIYRLCRQQGIYINLPGNEAESDFSFPGICLEDDVVVGVYAPSDDQRRARALRGAIQKLMDRMPHRTQTSSDQEE